MVDGAKDLFHRDRRTIDDIREAFKIEDPLEPLVAFSFKPRAGFDHAYALEMTRDVVKAGVRIVEFDTRNIEDPVGAFDQWRELAETAATVASARGLVGTFAPNLSHSSPVAVELADKWCNLATDIGPKTVKVDGGLDGLSTIQGIRKSHADEPIVTTYPTLRTILRSAIGTSDFWIEMLAMSGSDIIYPGNRPTFNETRIVGGDDTRSLELSAERYGILTKRRWPMPTFAAGVHPGHLQVAFELLGPDVAYFLGGAIALHPSGPGAGARLCMQILEVSRKHAKNALKKGSDFGEDLPAKLIAEIESYRANGLPVYYKSPSTVFGDRLKPFYRR